MRRKEFEFVSELEFISFATLPAIVLFFATFDRKSGSKLPHGESLRGLSLAFGLRTRSRFCKQNVSFAFPQSSLRPFPSSFAVRFQGSALFAQGSFVYYFLLFPLVCFRTQLAKRVLLQKQAFARRRLRPAQLEELHFVAKNIAQSNKHNLARKRETLKSHRENFEKNFCGQKRQSL
ncbi:MAG: hypothetical protein J6K28_04310 [Alistipes sp.]|nr:hypothetical protein [Alistipes sp.]